ncbi:MAG: hypothetical protein B6241_07445 [Spirochaetaceae bacterium 4572_59]|nr:MAG: hypothetical protein B6241_07445 [Spirochaetaceae bacterium 4572_59]
MYRTKILLLFIILSTQLLFSQSRRLTLSGPDISADNKILLSAENPVPAAYSYRTLILGNAESLEYGPLTVYPEQSGYYPGRKELRIHNHNGLFIYNQESRGWQTPDYMEPLKKGRSISALELLPLYDSPDGRYSVYVREEEGIDVSLYLYDHDLEKSQLLTGFIPREFSTELVKWSPDSRYFVYRRDRELYYFSIDQYLSKRIPAEEFRRLGHSNMNSVSWSPGNYLYMICSSLLYRLHSSEFFTRSFYADPFQKGSVWGRLPVEFNPVFDSYTINPEGSAIFLLKDEQDGLLFPLNSLYEEDKSSIRQFATLSVPSGQSISDFTWLNNSNFIVLVSDFNEGTGIVYTLDLKGSGKFSPLSDEQVLGFSVSPDMSQFALRTEDRVLIMDSLRKERLNTYELLHPLEVYWTEKGQFILGDRQIIEVSDNASTLIALSQVDDWGFDTENRVQGLSGDKLFLYKNNFHWEALEAGSLRPHRLSTEKFRIFLEERSGGWYAQSLKVRRVASYTSDDLMKPYFSQFAPELSLQHRREVQDVPWYFSQGNSQGRREVSLVFNAVNSAEGLYSLMEILRGYGVPATFFLNGDFINNYPDRTRMIADSGHTVGSLFYTYFDMSDPKYHINREFLKKGLARNEDDYFIVTGKEMAMIWHSPYYYFNREILDTTGVLKYTFIGSELEVPDRIAKDDSRYSETVPMIENLLNKIVPGTIIPVTVGRFADRDDYLSMNLAMLIEGLIIRGYDIVALFDLMDNKS